MMGTESLGSKNDATINVNGKSICRRKFLATHPLLSECKKMNCAGKKYSYVSGCAVVRTMNTVFGNEGWSSQVTSTKEVCCERDGNNRWVVGYVVTVRISLKDGISHEECGSSEATNTSKTSAHEKAIKAAINDGMKRAARLFGERLGNALFGGNGLETAPLNNVEAIAQLEQLDVQTKNEMQKSALRNDCLKDSIEKNNAHCVKDSIEKRVKAKEKNNAHCVKDSIEKNNAHCVKDSIEKNNAYCVKDSIEKNNALERAQRFLNRLEKLESTKLNSPRVPLQSQNPRPVSVQTDPEQYFYPNGSIVHSSDTVNTESLITPKSIEHTFHGKEHIIDPEIGNSDDYYMERQKLSPKNGEKSNQLKIQTQTSDSNETLVEKFDGNCELKKLFTGLECEILPEGGNSCGGSDMEDKNAVKSIVTEENTIAEGSYIQASFDDQSGTVIENHRDDHQSLCISTMTSKDTIDQALDESNTLQHSENWIDFGNDQKLNNKDKNATLETGTVSTMPTSEGSCTTRSENGRNLTIVPVNKFCDMSPTLDSMSEKTAEKAYEKPEGTADGLGESSLTFEDEKSLASSTGHNFFSNDNPTPVADTRKKQSEKYFNFPLSTKSEGCFTSPPSMEDHSQPMRAPAGGKVPSLTPTNGPFSRSLSLCSPLPSPSLSRVPVLSTKAGSKRSSTPKRSRKSMSSPRRSPFIALPCVEGYRTPKAASNFAKMISGSFKKSNAICQ